MAQVSELHKTWSTDATYHKEYESLEEEFTEMAKIAKAQRRAGFSLTMLFQSTTTKA